MCSVLLASRPCSETFYTITSLHSLLFFFHYLFCTLFLLELHVCYNYYSKRGKWQWLFFVFLRNFNAVLSIRVDQITSVKVFPKKKNKGKKQKRVSKDENGNCDN